MAVQPTTPNEAQAPSCTHERDWFVEVATGRIFRRPCLICASPSYRDAGWSSRPYAGPE